jgi:hypothetical protein
MTYMRGALGGDLHACTLDSDRLITIPHSISRMYRLSVCSPPIAPRDDAKSFHHSYAWQPADKKKSLQTHAVNDSPSTNENERKCSINAAHAMHKHNNPRLDEVKIRCAVKTYCGRLSSECNMWHTVANHSPPICGVEILRDSIR